MLAVFVRPPRSDAPAVAVLPTDLRAAKGEPEPLVARREDGPFLPISEALARDPRLADDMARALDVACVTPYSRFRRWLWLALIPMLVLMELERELVMASVPGIGRRLVADLLFFVFVVIDLARPLPRASRVVSVVLLAIALRYADMAARACGEHPALLPLGALSLAGAVGVWLIAPSRRALRDQVLAKTLHERTRTHAPRPDMATLGGALLVATGLPLMLLVARASHVGALPQGAMLLAWAIVAPVLFERWTRVSARPAAIGPRAWTLAAAVTQGLAATVALAHVWHYGVGALAHAWQCRDPAGFEHGLVKRFLDAQAVEATQDLEGARAKWVYITMTVLVVPLAEERVFRDVLQRVLSARFGARRGVSGAAALFGLAHLGVYGAATFDAVLLGVGFGVAYEQGGILASTLTHALWNLYWLS